jgi:hypothetical protein
MSGQQYFRLWFRELDNPQEIDLGLYVSANQAAKELALGLLDNETFQPSKCNFPFSRRLWNGLR